MVTNYRSELNDEQLLKLGKLIYGEDHTKNAMRKDITGLIDGIIDCLVDPNFDINTCDADTPVKKVVQKITTSSNVIAEEDLEQSIAKNPSLKGKPRSYIIGWTKVAKASNWKKSN